MKVVSKEHTGLRTLSEEEVILVAGGTDQKTDGYPDTWSETTWGEAACLVAAVGLINGGTWDNKYDFPVEADIFCGTNLSGDNPQAPGTHAGENPY
ncbi:MAG TPA: hypothetical protein VF662_07945 [Allosphingosinicella sp.]|jgi:hypothetical protein